MKGVQRMADLAEPRLPGTDYAQIKFVGMAAETPDRLRLGDEVVFKVTGRVLLVGEELDSDGVVHDVAKVKVISVVPA